MGNWVSNNWTNSDEYAASGTPFVTGSHGIIDLGTTVKKIVFPRVTRWIQIYNHTPTVGHAMKVGFTANGTADTAPPGETDTEAHYIYIPGNKETGRLELRCTELFVAATTSDRVNFTIVAGLTNIPPKNFFIMTGSIENEGTSEEHILGVG
jgi:hypothetical protein